MNSKFGLMAVAFSLTLTSGCVAYAPYPEYSGGPYGGYGYAAPVPVPVPMFYGGWRHHGHHHGHYRHHGHH